MARIGIDATSISRKGVERYQKNIVQSLSRLQSDHEYYVFLNRDFSIHPFIPQPHWHFIRVPIWKDIIWEQVQIPQWIHRLRLDLFHTTAGRLPRLGKGRFLLQLFEIPDHRIHLAQQAGSGYSFYSRISDRLSLALFPQSLKRATRILVSSRSTQRELTEKYRVDKRKILLAPLSHEAAFKPPRDSKSVSEIREKLGAPRGYLLHFSTQDPRENTEVVLRAFERARGRIDRGIKLLMIGCKKNLGDGVICKGYLEEAELIQAYQGALVYVDPSFYEGFALQVLEAMACGVPVIASNRSSIPEIAGDSGILIDPGNCDAAAQAVIRVVTDENLRNEMRWKGLERAKQFSWEAVAREVLLAYQEILSGPHRD